ncbi:hypothetical protein F4604DRAFT_1888808 [Suillus subluteus]|nr:hypothetical protein F4604DRAFT_1888808 [Suillus subluteus]
MAEAAMMTFTPIDNNIQQHFGAFHIDAHDHTRHVESHHFCSHRSKDFHQCAIYDSNTPDARLISIEYIVSGQSLPKEEKKYWHSHKHECLCCSRPNLFVGVVDDMAMQPVVLHLHQSYGKTIYTCRLDPPHLMMTYTGVNSHSDDRRDERSGISPSAKKLHNKADQWEASGTGITCKPEETQIQK